MFFSPVLHWVQVKSELPRRSFPKHSDAATLRTVTSYCYAVGLFSALFHLRAVQLSTITYNIHRFLYTTGIWHSACIGRMWMWPHVRNIACEQEARKYSSELEQNCLTRAHAHTVSCSKQTAQRTVTVPLRCAARTATWRHQPRTAQTASQCCLTRTLPYIFLQRGGGGRVWVGLRHCATRRKVAGSITDGVTENFSLT